MKKNLTRTIFFVLTCMCLSISSCKDDKEDDHNLNEYFSNLQKNYTDLLGKEVNPAKWHAFAPIFGSARKVEVTYYQNSEWDSVKQIPIPKEIDHKSVRQYNKNGFITEIIQYKYRDNKFYRTNCKLYRLDEKNKPIMEFFYTYNEQDSTIKYLDFKTDIIYDQSNLTATVKSYQGGRSGSLEYIGSETYHIDMTGRVDYDRAIDKDSPLNKDTDKRSTSNYYNPYEDIKKVETNMDEYGNWTTSYTLYYFHSDYNHPNMGRNYITRSIMYY